ncbi:ABC transporter ATP-binding protein/permease [Weeksellaceae bacterium KMM 9713]|uniref:ABC transporter ATP-binding protein/permease n=1 Tax=Profundicola chukchiensis TaxID=2961959 RepID=A0A9X4N451_9FLAO|nr:ABC transporter ATP-binding protein [Profundicola chukchiensis]MDG4946644.1 ABC transporter ATP-binding protein/permease [Profundicola chukchiensis]
MNTIKNLIKKYFSSFVYFYKHIGNRIFIMMLLSLAVSVLDGFGLTMFLPLLQMVSGDNSIDSEQLGNLSFVIEALESTGIPMTLTSILLFMILFFIFKGMAAYIKQVYFVFVQQSFIREMRIKLVHGVNSMNFKKFITSDTGLIQNTMSGEVAKVSNGFISYFTTFQNAIMVFVYVVFAFIVDAQFAVLVAIGGIATNFIYKIIYSKTKKASRELTTASHMDLALLVQHIANFKYLRATGMKKIHTDKLIKNIDYIENNRKKIGIYTGIGIAVREPLLVIVVAVVIIIQVKVLNGSMGALLVSLLFFYRALSSLMAMQQSWNTFLGVSGSLENMQNFQLFLEQNKESDGDLTFDKLKSNLEIKELSFAFDTTPILKNINLTINKNQSIAFVGESGSGKSTLVNILVGLLKPTSGNYIINKNSITKYKKLSFQQKIGYITQDAVIFNDTIYNNITFWAPKSDENLQKFNEVIKQAALEEFLFEIENGIDTVLGNNGINLSGGQKQRISIARELFKDIDILIMDEATSALDSETEKAIQDSVDNLKGKYTIIIIAHRLSTIRNVDKVVLMNKGEIIDSGEFNELAERNSRFRKMIELQEL